MTPEQMITHLTANTPLNALRAVFTSEMGKIEQAGSQRVPLTGRELRMMEFSAVERILAVAVELKLV